MTPAPRWPDPVRCNSHTNWHDPEEALMRVLAGNGLVSPVEVLEEIKAMRREPQGKRERIK